MGLSATLLSASGALNVHMRCVDVVSNNLSNVDNPAYARQQVNVGSMGTVITGEGIQNLGIEVSAITQMRDAVLDTQVIRDEMSFGSLQAQQKFYQQLELSLGEHIDRLQDNNSSKVAPDAVSGSNGISAGLDTFFNAFHEVSGAPSDMAKKTMLIEKATLLVNRFHSVSTRLSNLASDINTQVASDVTSVNSLLSQIANYNQQIQTMEFETGATANDLRDGRQAALESLANYMDFTTSYTSDNPPQFQVNAVSSTGTKVPLVTGFSAQGSLSYDSTTNAFSFNGTQLNIQGGSLNGEVTVLTTTLATLTSNLDTLASALVTEVNDAYNVTRQSGGTVDPSQDFFNSANLSAATISLMTGLSASTLRTSTSGNPGDNDLALAVATLQTTSIPTLSNVTFNKYMANIIATTGGKINVAAQDYNNQKLILQMDQNRRTNYGGVSINEEVADLMRFQQAFQASSRLIGIIDEMMRQIVTGLI